MRESRYTDANEPNDNVHSGHCPPDNAIYTMHEYMHEYNAI